MSDHAHRDLSAPDGIEALLAAYAEARLSPTHPVLARMRTAVALQAAARAAEAAALRRLDHDRTVGWRRALPDFHVPRRAIAFGLTALLTVGTTAAVLAAPPGSPFYGARISIENALVPDNPDARLAAHEGRLTQLLADAEAAADRGDAAALDAALAAYQDEVDAAIADLGDAPDRLARLEDELGRHVAVLTSLEARLPTQVAIEHALVASQKALDKLHSTSGKPAAKPTPVPHPTRPAGTDPDQVHAGGNPNQ